MNFLSHFYCLHWSNCCWPSDKTTNQSSFSISVFFPKHYNLEGCWLPGTEQSSVFLQTTMTVQESPEGRLSQTLQEKHIKKLLHSRDTGKAPAHSVFKAAVCLATAGLGLVLFFFFFIKLVWVWVLGKVPSCNHLGYKVLNSVVTGHKMKTPNLEGLNTQLQAWNPDWISIRPQNIS